MELILERLAYGWSHDTVLEAYPRLVPEDIRAALSFAANLLSEERYIEAAKAAA